MIKECLSNPNDFKEKLVTNLIDQITDDEFKAVLAYEYKESLEGELSEMKDLSIKIFGREIIPEEFEKLFSDPEKKLKCASYLRATGRLDNRNLRSTAILYTEDGGSFSYAGIIEIAFSNKTYPLAFSLLKNLEVKGKQLGLEIQCKTEEFCRENNIWRMENEAVSDNDPNSGRSLIGAYATAFWGYGFANEEDRKRISEQFKSFCIRKKIKPEKNIDKLSRPVDFASLEGFGLDGKPLKLGKECLLQPGTMWKGTKDMSLNSPDTREFIKYLHNKHRHDLVERYFSEIGEGE